jgi:hypothetical protein
MKTFHPTSERGKDDADLVDHFRRPVIAMFALLAVTALGGFLRTKGDVGVHLGMTTSSLEAGIIGVSAVAAFGAMAIVGYVLLAGGASQQASRRPDRGAGAGTPHTCGA